MKIRWLAWVLVAVGTPGCLSFQAALHYPFVFADYGRTGFTVADDTRTFRFDGARNLSSLEIGRLKLEDHQNDGAVDLVKSGTLEYLRGEPGTAPLFKDMDRLWADTVEYMSVGHFRRSWEERKPQDLMGRWQTHPRWK